MNKNLALTGLNSPELFFEAIDEAFNTDNESWEQKGESIIHLYNMSSEDEREMLDDLMIHLTGYSIKSLYQDASKRKLN